MTTTSKLRAARRPGPARAHRGRLLIGRRRAPPRPSGSGRRQHHRPLQGDAAHRRPGGHRRPGAADRGRADQQAAVQGDLVRLHLRAADAAGDGRRRGRHRRGRRRTAGVRRRGRRQGGHRRRGRRTRSAPRSWCRRTHRSTRWPSCAASRSRWRRAVRPTTTCWPCWPRPGSAVQDVTLDYLQPADALAAFASGQVDAWDIWSPYIEQAVAQDHARILVTGVGYGSPYSFEVASRARLPTRPKRPRSGTT